MNWTDLGWMGLGLGLGVGLGMRNRGRSPATERRLPLAHPVESKQEKQSQPLQLAYQLATEMSQFKGGFLARTSHELRSPLNGLIGMHQLILENLCDGPEEEREFIAQANQSALKMIKVLDTVLDVARLEHGKLQMESQPLQLAALLQTVHDLTALQAADRNLRLYVTLPDSNLYILADPRRLRQTLVHLMDVLITQMETGNLQVSVHVAVETRYADIWIDSDWSGSDHPPSLSEPIDLLQSPAPTASPIPSPGLNLLACQMLVSLMQGTLTVVEAAGENQLRLQCSIPLFVAD